MLRRLADLWGSRSRVVDPSALEAVRGLAPAAVVTGASEGIGRAIADRLAADGLAVILVARRSEPLEKAAAVIARRSGGIAVAVAADVTAPDTIGRIEAAADAAGLYVDVVVNSAGIGLCGEFVTDAAEDIDRLLALNVTAATRLMRHWLPGMLARGRGGILNVASLGAYAPGPHQAAYYASKAYLVSLTEAVAHECRGRGVRVSVVAPGPVATRFHARMGADGALYRWLIPAPSPESVAKAALSGYHLGRVVVWPGLVAPVLGAFLSVTPHFVLVPIVGWLLKPRGGRR